MHRRFVYLLSVLFVTSLLLSSAVSQTVISRTRVGNFPEGTAYVSTGALAGNAVVLDGFDVYAFPLVKSRRGPVATKVFDLKQLAIQGHPNAVAYIPQEKLFAFTEGLSPDKIFLSDESGKPQGEVTIRYPNGWMPSHVEGITYIPPDAAIFPDHFVTAPVLIGGGPEGANDSRLEVIARDGTVDWEILPSPLPWMSDWGGSFLGGVDYLPGGTLICGLDNYLVEYTFNGTMIRNVWFDKGFFEGITRLPDSSYVAVGYEPGVLTFLDSNFQRTPALDRNYLFTPGIADWQSSIAWNGDTGKYLLRFLSAPVTGTWEPGIWALPPTLGSIGKMYGFPEYMVNPNRYRQMVYMPDEHLVAVLYRHDCCDWGPPHADIHLYDNWGNLVDQIHLTFQYYDALSYVPGQLTYVPNLQEFVVRVANSDGTPTPFVAFIPRWSGGWPNWYLDLSSAGIASFGAMVYFNDGTDKLLFNVDRTHSVVTGLGGVPLQTFNPREKLGILNSGATSIGSVPGTFATIDGGEFVVYSLAGKKKK